MFRRYEKPLLLQTCRLLRGFTHPGTYFEASTEELALYSVEKFADEMDGEAADGIACLRMCVCVCTCEWVGVCMCVCVPVCVCLS